MKYRFLEQQKMTALPNGKVRCYFNEEVSEEAITRVSEDGESGESETHNAYDYDAVDLDAPVTKPALIDALVRARYSQSDVEAIMRHKLAGYEDTNDEFSLYNLYVEGCKAEADRILSE